MIRIRKGILVLILSLLVTLGVFALDNDYKNNLLKVDIVKTGTDQYRIDLFTQKPYSSPVKVIKKTDTSYYILLPETYHSITSAQACDDVRNLDIKLYPYAGQDLNNGYTKVNITTSKPLDIVAEVKTASASTVPKVDFEKLAKLDSIFAQQAAQKPVEKAAEAPKNANVVPVETLSKAAAAQKAEQALKEVPSATREVKPPSRTVIIDIDSDNISEPALPQKQVTVDMVKISGRGLPELDTMPEEISSIDLGNSGTVGEEQGPSDETAEVTEDNEMFTNEEVYPLTDLSTLGRIKSKLRALHNLALENLTATVGIGAVLLLMFLIALNKRKKRKEQAAVGIQSQTDVMQNDPLQAMKEAAARRREEEVEEIYQPSGEVAGQPQEQSHAPIEPSVPVEQHEAPYSEQGMHVDETQYIHEAKPEETYIQEQLYIQEQYVAQVQLQPPLDYMPYEPASTGVPFIEPLGVEEEAQVLSHVEIEPGRGFYLARYEGTVSLLGFVGQNLFIIHHFKYEPQDMRIMYRLSERSSEGTFYLVKVEDVKMLVRSSQNALSLELLM